MQTLQWRPAPFRLLSRSFAVAVGVSSGLKDLGSSLRCLGAVFVRNQKLRLSGGLGRNQYKEPERCEGINSLRNLVARSRWSSKPVELMNVTASVEDIISAAYLVFDQDCRRVVGRRCLILGEPNDQRHGMTTLGRQYERTE